MTAFFLRTEFAMNESVICCSDLFHAVRASRGAVDFHIAVVICGKADNAETSCNNRNHNYVLKL